jgi:hypothetical protein
MFRGNLQRSTVAPLADVDDTLSYLTIPLYFQFGIGRLTKLFHGLQG